MFLVCVYIYKQPEIKRDFPQIRICRLLGWTDNRELVDICLCCYISLINNSTHLTWMHVIPSSYHITSLNVKWYISVHGSPIDRGSPICGLYRNCPPPSVEHPLLNSVIVSTIQDQKKLWISPSNLFLRISEILLLHQCVNWWLSKICSYDNPIIAPTHSFSIQFFHQNGWNAIFYGRDTLQVISIWLYQRQWSNKDASLKVFPT